MWPTALLATSSRMFSRSQRPSARRQQRRPAAGGAEEAAAPGEQQAPGRRLLLGLGRHTLWRAWLDRRGSGTALQRSWRAQRPWQWRRRQQHRRKLHRRMLHQAAQHRLQAPQPSVKVRPTGSGQRSNALQLSESLQLLASSKRLERRRLAWVSTDGAGQAMNR